MTVSTLRRRLARKGYRLSSRGGYFQIWDLVTRGLVHDGGCDGFPFTFADALAEAEELLTA